MCWQVSANSKKKSFIYQAKDVIYTAPPQSLLKHLKDPLERKKNYKNRLNNLPDPSGAVVFYSALKKEHIKKNILESLSICFERILFVICIN